MTNETDNGGGKRGETMISPSVAFTETATAPPVPAFDAEKYRDLLGEIDLTEDQQREMLEMLWSIMYSFVELGFNCDVCSVVFKDQENIADQALLPVGSSLQAAFTETTNSAGEDGPA